MGARDDGRPDRRHVESWDRKVVTDKVRALERARDDGNITKPGVRWTVGEWVEHWLNNIARLTTGGNGWDAYYYATKHIVRHVGAHKLPNLRADHLERMYSKMQENGSSSGTAHQVHRTIRTALNEAVRRGYLVKNPALIAKAPRIEESEIEPLRRGEITRLFTTALKGRNAARWVVAIALGLRQGEALGLRWRDLDLHECTLSVAIQRPRPKWKHGCRGTCGRKHAGHCPDRTNQRKSTTAPKSKAGRRTVGLPQPLIDLLTVHQAEQEAERAKAAELWQEGGWLFTDETGQPLNHRTDHVRWKKLLDAAGVRDARLHDARHTAATVLLELGVPDRAAMQVMGWSNPALAQRYQHATGSVLGQVASRVGTHLWERPGEGN